MEMDKLIKNFDKYINHLDLSIINHLETINKIV